MCCLLGIWPWPSFGYKNIHGNFSRNFEKVTIHTKENPNLVQASTE